MTKRTKRVLDTHFVVGYGVVQGDGHLTPPAAAKKMYANWRGQMGATPNATNLLTWPSAQPKTGKNQVPTYILHLLPHEGSNWNVCPWATAGCAAACLNTAGRGVFSEVQEGRRLRTELLGVSTNLFASLLTHEIDLAVKRHNGLIAVRLNGTSDIRWEKLMPFLFTRWGDAVIFYDYTKAPIRTVPSNYHLTYSVNENDSNDHILKMLDRYGRVAVVFDVKKGHPLPDSWLGIPVVDGDLDDQRWLDHGVVVGLRAKGAAKQDSTGFVRVAFPTKERECV